MCCPAVSIVSATMACWPMALARTISRWCVSYWRLPLAKSQPHQAATSEPMSCPTHRHRPSSAGTAATRLPSCTVSCAGRPSAHRLHHEQTPEPSLVLDVDALGLLGGVGACPALRAALQSSGHFRRRARHRSCASPRPSAMAHWRRLPASFGRHTAARIPIEFAP